MIRVLCLYLYFLLLTPLGGFSQKPALIVPSGQNEEYDRSSFLNSGRQLAIARGNTLTIWETRSGLLLRSLFLPDNTTYQLLASPDDKSLVVVGANYITKVDGSTLDIHFQIHGRFAAFKGNSNELVIGRSDSILMVDYSNGNALEGVKAGIKEESRVIVSQKGNFFMVLSSADSTLSLWDFSSHEIRYRLKEPDAQIFNAGFSPDESRLLVAYNNNKARVYGLNDTVALYQLNGGFIDPPDTTWTLGGTGYVPVLNETNIENTSCYSNDGNHIMLWGGKQVTVWDSHTGEILTKKRCTAGGVFSADSKQLIAIFEFPFSEVNTLEVYELGGNSDPKIEYTIKGKESEFGSLRGIGKVSLNKESDILLTPNLEILDLKIGKTISALKNSSLKDISSVTKIAGSNWLISDAKEIRVLNIKNGRLLTSIPGSLIGLIDSTIAITSEVEDSRYAISLYNMWDIGNLSQPRMILSGIRSYHRFREILIAYNDDSVFMINCKTKEIYVKLKGKLEAFSRSSFEADPGIILHHKDSTFFYAMNSTSAKLTWKIPGRFEALSPDSGKIITQNIPKNAFDVWSIKSRKILFSIFNTSKYSVAGFSPGSKVLVVSDGMYSMDRGYYYASLYNMETGKFIRDIGSSINRDVVSPVCSLGPKWYYFGIEHSSLTEYTSYYDQQGRPQNDLSDAKPLFLSPDNTFFIVSRKDSIEIWSNLNGNKVTVLSQAHIKKAYISPDSKCIYTIIPGKSSIYKWEASSGKLLKEISTPVQQEISSIDFSGNGKYLMATCYQPSSTIIWENSQGNYRFRNILPGTNHYIEPEELIITDGFSGGSGGYTVYDANSLSELFNFPSAHSYEPKFRLDTANALIISPNQSVIDIFNLRTRRKLYSIVPRDEKNYLLIDDKSRYDGTETARKSLYFTCGTEIVELDQLKDQLWVPNLAERIWNGDSINAKTLDELNICRLTPVIENMSFNKDEYYFKVTPRRGGLGEVVLSVNGIEVKHYKPGQLELMDGAYGLHIEKEQLREYFIAGKENPVTLKAFITENGISSRGATILENKRDEIRSPPNLYAVMIGVSDYKGDELDLKYAAKDARDISSVVDNAARKLLNNDGSDHVFTYNLTTDKEHYQLPEKKSIKKLLLEIGAKATSNDILLIFFAGHGLMGGLPSENKGEKSQFYFLTADASKISTISALDDVGISTSELTEWIKPQNIKAQKRILIFDACNSGQAIKDFVRIGNEDQNYLVARNDDKARQIKAVEDLNEKSGLYILSASASNQSAFEMGRYSQGLLTYSLLKVIKQQPDILEDGKYLNLSRWFNAAGKTASDLSKENGARQEPQIVSNTNFNIGMVDQELLEKIVLPREIPLFSSSNFQNGDENVIADDLGLNKLVDQKLSEISHRGAETAISYASGSNSPDAYALSGRYIIKYNEISIKIMIRKNNENLQRLELKGSIDKLNELADSIINKSMMLIK